MKVALLLGAIPVDELCGPRVMLRKGTWKVEVEGLVDSYLALYLDGVGIDIDNHIILKEQNTVQLTIKTAGTEKFISAFAVKHA
jgi:hypothetical protein